MLTQLDKCLFLQIYCAFYCLSYPRIHTSISSLNRDYTDLFVYCTLPFDASVWKDGQKSFEDQGDCSKMSCKGETKRKRRKEFPPDDQGCKGKFQKDAFFDHLVTKSGEEIEGIYCCKSEKHNKLNDYGAELGNATGAFKHLKQFQSTSYQESYCPEEHEKTTEKRILLRCQYEHMTRKKS